MNASLKYSFLIAGLVVSAAITAQNPINQDVKVVREFAPSVMDANKLEQMPVLDDTSTYHPSFNYSILSRAFETNKGIEPISPATLAADRGGELTNSLAKAGIGSYSSVMAELDYNVLRSEDYALGLELKHFTSLGKLDLENGENVDAPYHDTKAGLYFKRFFKETTLSSKLAYQHNLFDYYGYQTIDPSLEYVVDGQVAAVPGSDLLMDTHQRFGHLVMDFGLCGNETSKSSTLWKGNIAYASFGNKTGVHQNKIDLYGDVSVPINDLRLNVDGGISSFRVDAPDQSTMLLSFNNDQRTIVKLNPRLEFGFDGGSIEAGMLIVSEMGSKEDKLKLAPQLTGQLMVADGVVTLFGGFKGNYNANDYTTIAYENPFVSPDANVKSSFYGIDLHAGLKGNFSASTSFTTKVDYSFFNDEHFYANRSFVVSPANGVDDSLNFVNIFEPIYDDGTLLKLAGELNIEPNDRLNLRLSGVYYGWELENEEKAWHRPEVEFGLFGRYKVNSSLLVHANLSVLGKRYAKEPELAGPKELKSYVDLNVGANYKLARQWTLWGQIANATASSYYRWNGYPSYKFNAMVGVGYSF